MMDGPLSKIFFILANTYAGHVAVRPPQAHATTTEQAKYRARGETSDLLSLISWVTVPAFMVTNAAFGACDAYMALAAVYPSLRISALDSILLPDPSKPLSTSDFYLTIPFVIGSLFLSAGALLRQACYRTLGRHFTFQLSLQKDHKLVTEGPYSFVRHPSYLGMIIALPGMAVAQLFSSGTWWIQSGMWHTWQGQIFGAYWISFLSYVCWALLSRVPKEDAMLQAQFGEQWVSWSKKTRYAVIPYVW